MTPLAYPTSRDAVLARLNLLSAVAPYVDVGGVGDGVADDTTAFASALADGRAVNLAGRTWRIASALVTTGNHVIVGPGTLLFDSTQVTAWDHTGDLSLYEVTGDGNNSGVNTVISVDGDLLMWGGALKNVFANGTNGVRALVLFGDSDIEGTRFQAIGTPKDNTVGNAQGAVQAILMSAGKHRIANCKFIDINNRATAGGTLQYEDSDAILAQSTTTSVDVDDCYFESIGKRCLKLNTSAGTRHSFTRNRILSSYTGTTDASGTNGNGMRAIVELMGGSVEILENKLLGGVVGFFGVVSGSDPSAMTFRGNRGAAEYHRYVNTEESAIVLVPNTAASTFELEFDDNTLDGFYRGCNTQAKIRRISHCRNALKTLHNGLEVNAGAKFVTALGNHYEPATGTTASTTSHNGIWIGNGTEVFQIANNTATGKYHAVRVLAQTGNFKGVVRDTIAQSLVGSVFNDGTSGSADLSASNNVAVA